jgi:gliding motility-associated-like protein
MKYLFKTLFLLCIIFQAHATHYRAGEIRFENVIVNGSPTLTYKIIVTTYTRFDLSASQSADRCTLTLYVGSLNSPDSSVMNRANGPLGINPKCITIPSGEILFNNNKYKKNVYETMRTFAVGNLYKLYVFDRNRVDEIANVNNGNSVNTPFALETEIDLRGGVFNNSSPVFNNLPLDKACNFKCFYHNPGATDVDGDSLAYFIDTCRGENLDKITGFTLPNNITMLADGTFSWCTPSTVGIYNFAIRVEEYRKVNNKYRKIGYVIRDFQVDVDNCLNNPPTIVANDTCIEAGKTAKVLVKAFDSENNLIKMKASGQPFGFSPVATFTKLLSVPGSAISEFVWQTKCIQIRKQPYSIVVRAIDNSNPDSLTRYQSFNVSVIGPPITNLNLQASGSKVKLTWNKPSCAIPKTSFNSNGIVGYSIYRKLGCDTFKFDPCLGANNPISSYQLIGTTLSIDSLQFLDDDNGNGLSFESAYSYFVVPNYFDGALSKISKQVCIRLSRNVPGIINVDVVKTDVTNGEIFVRWLKPLIGGANLDTLIYGGPYKFDLRRFDVSNASDNGTIVTSITKPFFKSLSNLADTTYKDFGLNTRDKQYKYQVDFFATPAVTSIGSSNTATSTYLKLRGNNKKMILSWEAKVPWENYQYFVYQETTPNNFIIVDTTKNTTDTIYNLVNGNNYCFKVVCRGKFIDTYFTFDSLVNASQIACGNPKDLNAPCLLTPSLLADCESSTLSIAYRYDKTETCDTNDVLKLKLWRAFTDTSKFFLVDSITNLNNRQFLYKNTESLAGCYAVSAVDSSNNESELSNKVCIDNCDYKFDLPNIFTPNGDTANELYTPIKKEVKFVNKLDFKIYDRWGLLVYETNDILINWNGNLKKTSQKCSDGVYFYVGSATIGRLKGNEVKKFTGYIHLQRGQ